MQGVDVALKAASAVLLYGVGLTKIILDFREVCFKQTTNDTVAKDGLVDTVFARRCYCSSRNVSDNFTDM